MSERTTRFSGADWYSENSRISVIGQGGVGSWLSINLSRIGHELMLIDGDLVDETNVTGGQAYRNQDVGRYKVDAIRDLCREMGCVNGIWTHEENFDDEIGLFPIVMTGLDNMKARKMVFDEWTRTLNRKGENKGEYLLIDGRLLMENMEVVCVQGDREDQIMEYREKYLFGDEEVAELDCTAKQTTFGAMIIAGIMTATLCNWLTNRKLGDDFREIPFYQRFYLPILKYDNKTTENEELSI